MLIASSAPYCLAFPIPKFNILPVCTIIYINIITNVYLISLCLYMLYTYQFSIWTGGLIFKAGGSNMQHVTSLSFLLLVYSNYLSHANHGVPCGQKSASPALLKRLAKHQVTIFHFSRPKINIRCSNTN